MGGRRQKRPQQVTTESSTGDLKTEGRQEKACSLTGCELEDTEV